MGVGASPLASPPHHQRERSTVKLLLVSNAPWAKTGYGIQGASLARRLQADGHYVAYMANYGLHGGNIEWQGIPILSNGLEGGYADPIIHGHIRAVQPDLVLTIFDIWALRGREFPVPQSQEHLAPRWAAWIPIDHDPMSAANFEMVQRVTYPIAMSSHGHRLIEERGFTASYIPHGVEKDVHYTGDGRREIRRLFLLPEDAFLFGSVGLNRNYPSRKGLDRLIAAFAKMPKNAYLYLHTLSDSQVGSIDLRGIVDFYGVKDRVIFPDTYNYVLGYSQEGMNAIYSAIDCYVQPTMGEGFGLPVLEAQACGCPVIATDCTSMPELVCPETSELVPGVPIFVPDFAVRTLIDIDKLAASMLRIMGIYQDDRRGYAAMRAFAGRWANAWDWDKVYAEQWRPFLADVARDVERAPRKKWHRGMGLVIEHDGYVRKQDSNIRSPAVAKELRFLEEHAGPGIIPVLRKGVDEADGTTWFEMPRMTPLRDMDPQAMQEPERQRILDKLSQTLNWLHERGVAHRDVCPENVVVDSYGDPYLIDFEWAAHCPGEPCVDFKPWEAMSHAVPIVQTGSAQRGYHTIVSYLRGIDLDQKTHGYKGVPYQAIDGVGERDCQLRWDLMQPDVRGKSVLDVGCNLGWFVRKSLEEGALGAYGFDNDAAVLDAAAALTANPYANYASVNLDEEPDGWLVTGHWDVAFCLSVLQHLKDPDRVLRWLTEHADTIYIETPPRFLSDYMEEVLRGADYLGESERGRPMFRVKVLDAVPA